MKLDFARNTRRNMAASFANKTLGLLLPFLNRTLFLWLMGPEYLGLNGLFTSILGVLSLADLGFGAAVVYAMYKPVADDDRDLLCAYLRFFKVVYRAVGGVIFGLGLCLIPFLPRLIHGNVPADLDIRILYLLHLANTSAGYLLFAYRGSVLNAYHRGDVVTNIRTCTSIAQYATVFAILFATRNYYHYVIATVAFTVLNNLLTVWQARRLFPEIVPRGNLPADCRRRVVSDVKSIFMHKAGWVVTNQADNIVISAFLGLVAVAAYGNYWYVCSSVGGLVWVVYNSMQSGFGNTILTEGREANFSRFMKAVRLTETVTLAGAFLMAGLYRPFIALWTRGDPALSRHGLTPALMVLFFYINQSRQPLLTFKAAAGLWRQDRWKPIVAAAANLAMNIGFVVFLPDAYKLDGVVLSTIISLILIQVPWESGVVFGSFFGRAEARAYWRLQARFATLALVLCTAAFAASYAVPLQRLLSVMGK